MDISVRLTTYPGLDDRIVIVRAGDEVDAVFVRTDRFNVLVDTLGTPSLCREALALLDDQMGDRPLLVINSHMDWDHFWGNSGLDDRIPIIAHAKVLERLNDPAARDKLVENSATHDFGMSRLLPPIYASLARASSWMAAIWSSNCFTRPDIRRIISRSGSLPSEPVLRSMPSSGRSPKSGARILTISRRFAAR